MSPSRSIYPVVVVYIVLVVVVTLRSKQVKGSEGDEVCPTAAQGILPYLFPLAGWSTVSAL